MPKLLEQAHDYSTFKLLFSPDYRLVSGLLAGQKFEITPDGASIGRDATLSQIVITDPRISKRHVWIGVKDGRVIIADQNS